MLLIADDVAEVLASIVNGTRCRCNARESCATNAARSTIRESVDQSLAAVYWVVVAVAVASHALSNFAVSVDTSDGHDL
jgi:hypothetical protein